ncbi:hypothetical protein B0H19DRAFT_1060510 [Mycena capillaripes]|nr:hypothetical protein B0H19DRAFT_1060510 [Mycena capillaripes]
MHVRCLGRLTDGLLVGSRGGRARSIGGHAIAAFRAVAGKEPAHVNVRGGRRRGVSVGWGIRDSDRKGESAFRAVAGKEPAHVNVRGGRRRGVSVGWGIRDSDRKGECEMQKLLRNQGTRLKCL